MTVVPVDAVPGGTLLVVSPNRTDVRARICATVEPWPRVWVASGWSAVPALVEREPVCVAVVDTAGQRRVPLEELRWLRRKHPEVAIVVVVEARGRELEMYRLGRQGVDGLVLVEVGELEANLGTVIETAQARAEARGIARRLRGLVDPLVLEDLRWAIANAHLEAGPEDLARGTGRKLSAHRRELHQAGLPQLSRLLLWGRLFRAGHLLVRGGPPVEAVAHRLGYAGASSLARALRRETGLPPSEIRARGGVACVLEAFLTGPDRAASKRRTTATLSRVAT